MDTILQCGQRYKDILSVKYHFTISVKRKIRKLTLDFCIEDFRHASGLHYIDDISIESNPSKVIDSILNQQITDDMLAKSNKYTTAKTASGSSIKERIAEMCYLEEYLDSSDIIRIYEMQNFGSFIKADYYIEATNRSRQTTVYIFIRKRIENDNYVMVSFFKKYENYKGSAAYWMLKEKEKKGVITELYRNKQYKEKDV